LFLIGTLTPVAAQDDLIASMTLEQRVGQMFMVTLHGSVVTEQGAAFLRTYQPGAVVLFTSNLESPDQITRPGA
jgi:beta-N-acetylhexosaminidase